MQQDTDDWLDDPLAVAETWLGEGRQVALATVIQTWGSSPRPVGSQLVIDGDGAFAGSVSGGCIEGAVVQEALEVIAGGGTRCLEFGVSDEQAWDVGLTCGGKVAVLVELLGVELLGVEPLGA
ncbi:MAG: XdhC family protein [Gammaproteobacteria bacterium]|nr:XdhC family protein [Gammaproteobacteria bacterium]